MKINYTFMSKNTSAKTYYYKYGLNEIEISIDRNFSDIVIYHNVKAHYGDFKAIVDYSEAHDNKSLYELKRIAINIIKGF